MRKTGTILTLLIVFTAMAFLVGKVCKIGQNKPTLRYNNLQSEVFEKFKKMFQDGKHAQIIVNPNGPWDWENDSDFGNDQERWNKEEDDLFIIYYHKDKDAVWQGYAQSILKCAHENIPRLEEVMGHYYYPHEMNGRKLPIYLCNSENDYAETTRSIGGTTVPNSLGVTLTSIGRFGCKTEGIVLHPNCFKVAPAHINGYRKVLLHEMTHSVHRSSIDASKEFNIYNWQTEGIAEYCCERNEREKIYDADRIGYIERKCQLDNDFPSELLAEYWAGESFFLFLDQEYGKEFVRDFIQYSVNAPKDSLFEHFAHTAEEDHELWVQRLNGISPSNNLDSEIDSTQSLAVDSLANNP